MGMTAMDVVRSGRSQQHANQANVYHTDATIRGESNHAYGKHAKQLVTETAAQVEVTDYKRVNQQVYGVGTASIPANSVEFMRAQRGQAQVASARAYNSEMRGTHHGSMYGNEAVQFSTEATNQARVHKDLRVNTEQRGEFAGQPTGLSTSSRGYQFDMAHQNLISDMRAVNEQLYNVGVGTLPKDTMENTRVKDGQEKINGVRRVNEQVRGENAGTSTYGFESRQLQTEHNAQHMVHKDKRVNEQQRGELAGRSTTYNTDSKQMASTLAAPKLALVNEQVKRVGRGAIPSNSFSNHHAKTMQAQWARNDRDKKAHQGATNAFGSDSKDMTRARVAPKPAAPQYNVRGDREWANATPTIAFESKSIQLAQTAPKNKLVNHQFAYGNNNSNRDKADVSAYDNIAEWKPDSERVAPAPRQAVKFAVEGRARSKTPGAGGVLRTEEVRSRSRTPNPVGTIRWARAPVASFFGLKSKSSKKKTTRGADRPISAMF